MCLRGCAAAAEQAKTTFFASDAKAGQEAPSLAINY
jgi:hypothetical protein